MKTKLLVLYYIIFLGTILRKDSKCLITWLCVSLWDCLRSRKWRKPTGSLGLWLGLSIVVSPGYTLPVMSAWATNNTHSSWSGGAVRGNRKLRWRRIADCLIMFGAGLNATVWKVAVRRRFSRSRKNLAELLQVKVSQSHEKPVEWLMGRPSSD